MFSDSKQRSLTEKNNKLHKKSKNKYFPISKQRSPTEKNNKSHKKSKKKTYFQTEKLNKG